MIVAGANTNFYTVTNSWNVVRSNVGDANFDFVTFVDYLFAANGDSFFKYDATTTTNFSLPPPNNFSATFHVGGSLSPGITATFNMAVAFINDRGYFGPISNSFEVTLSGSGFNSIDNIINTTIPSGYGITAIALYRSLPNDTALFFTTFAPAAAAVVNDPGFPITTEPNATALFFTLVPRYLELYNNQLFLAGFSSLLSTVYWSDIGEPESIQPESFAEIRTNDGDRITGMQTYNGSIVIFKQRSFHRITGDSPENFSIQEVSDQYGCVSNRAAVIWENYLWFLDPKGVVEYNGANVQVVSTKMEPVFLRMNLSAAKDNAEAIHYKDRNEVWFNIPIDGSSVNNCIVVYDYVAQAWTKYEGLEMSSLFLAQSRFAGITPLFGGYTGTLDFVGSSLMSDRGKEIVCTMDTSFHTKSEETVQALWRRFYLNINPVSTTQAISVDLMQDYGASFVLSRTMYQQPFQSRIEYGLSSRSIAAHVEHHSATLPFIFYGYAFEWRFLRNI